MRHASTSSPPSAADDRGACFDPRIARRLTDPDDSTTTRAELVRRASAGALGLGLFGLDGLLDPADAEAARAPHASGDTLHFRSRPDLRPPRLDVLRDGGSDRSLFLAPSSGAGQRGVLILDAKGSLVYFRPTAPDTAMNFRTAVYRGEPVLTWWQGHANAGLGVGFHMIVDSSYREVARLPAGGGRQSDLHEFAITPQGTALVTSYEVRDADLRSVGGPSKGKAIGGIVQEIAIPSARVLFEWRSLDHVAIEESHAAFNGHSYDYFHINSIDVDADGNYLVSARNTWTIYKIDSRTGRVIWRLGGKRSDFTMGPGTEFAWQHDARHHEGGGLISLFANNAAPPAGPQSRILVLELDRRNRRATLARAYTHPRRLLSPFMGNAQLLPNGNVVVGWGGLPYVTEFARGGGIHFDAKLPRGGQNYRAFRLPWTGRPHRPPRLVSEYKGGRKRLFVSWNGATEVAAWRIEAGRSRASLRGIRTKARRSFETEFERPGFRGLAVAVALDARGRELGRSNAVRV